MAGMFPPFLATLESVNRLASTPERKLCKCVRSLRLRCLENTSYTGHRIGSRDTSNLIQNAESSRTKIHRADPSCPLHISEYGHTVIVYTDSFSTDKHSLVNLGGDFREGDIGGIKTLFRNH